MTEGEPDLGVRAADRAKMSAGDKAVPRGAEPQAPPPLLGSWRNLYLLLLAELGVLVLLFYALTRWAS